MKRHGVSEAEVARRIGLSPAAISNWRHEGFVRLPRQSCLSALAQVTGLTYGEVLTAALLDIGYVDNEEQAAAFRLILDDPPR
ncbi:helix-turn-helix domain-containing protein [Mycobacteroides abscessus]|uniref:helix-turn-helix domain-containing protein n=1 Tax=Mycobacteroides abscessus TaxID=36809 RepID=UPI000C25A312